MPGPRICLGVIAGAHGVRGLVKVKSYTDEPRNLVAYGPLTDEAGGRRFSLEIVGESKGLLLVHVEGVADRNGAEALKGLRLHVLRSALPDPGEEEYYHADLVGLSAFDGDGTFHGTVKAVQNYGAGDILEIEAADGDVLLLPFTKAAVPEVDIPAGRLVIAPPQEAPDRPEDAPS